MRRFFSLEFKEFRPSCTRVNYSISQYKQKVYFYGGIDDQNKVLQSMDDFDASTYKFTAVKYRGDYIPKAR